MEFSVNMNSKDLAFVFCLARGNWLYCRVELDAVQYRRVTLSKYMAGMQQFH